MNRVLFRFLGLALFALLPEFGRGGGCLAQTGFEFSTKISHVDIPFDYVNHFILLHLRMNKRLPVTFIFDTGAESTVVTRRELTDFLRIDYSRRFQMQGSDLSDTIVVYLARQVHLEAPGVAYAPQQDILVLEEDYFRFDAYTGVPVYGILSASTMSNFLVEIDYARARIRLHRTGKYDPGNHGYIAVPMLVQGNKPYIFARVSVVPDSTITLKLLLDTGATLPLMLFHHTHPLLSLPVQTVPSQIAMGLGGHLEGYTGRVAKVEIGPFEQQSVITYFQEIDSSAQHLQLNERNGLIGNLIFRRFHVIFDYKNSVLWLKPARKFKEPYHFDRSGIYLIATGDHPSGLVVQYVMPGSPGDEAGVRRGDRLISAGNKVATAGTMPAINRILQKKAGKKVQLVLKRGDREFETKIVLRDLL